MVPEGHGRSLPRLPDVIKATLAQTIRYAVALACVGALAGCARTTEPGTATAAGLSSAATASAPTQRPTQPPTQPPTQAPTQRAPRLAISITGRTVQPTPAQVSLAVGNTLTLVITSDRDNTLHAHGFDVEAHLGAGQPTTVTLTGQTPGSYEVETHDPELRLLVVNVR
jgi:hypothetical protein